MKLILTYFLISLNGYDWDFLRNNYLLQTIEKIVKVHNQFFEYSVKLFIE